MLVSVGAAANTVALLYPLVVQRLIDEATVRLHASPFVWSQVSSLAVIVLVSGAALWVLRDFLTARLTAEVDLALSARLFGKQARLPYLEACRRTAGQWTIAFEQIQELKVALGIFGAQSVFDLLLMLGYFALLCRYDLSAAVLYLAVSLLAVATLALVCRSLYVTVERAFETRARAQSLLIESLGSPLLIRAFRLAGWAESRWRNAYEPCVALFRKADVLGSVSAGAFQLFHRAGPLAVLAWKLPAVGRGEMTIGEVLAMSTIFGLGFDPLVKLGALVARIQKAVLSYRNVKETLGLPEEDGKDGVFERPDGALSVRLENVGFAYPGAPARPVLGGIELEALAGEKIALVGKSGVGKSTLLHLLLGLYPPSSGTLLIDGIPIEQIPLGRLREWVGLVSQETQLFSGTVLENIALGNAAPSLPRARRCASLVCATDFIDALPLGYDTPVGERGVALSAGQRQRLSLARALYRDPKILLLDEPTSALDALTEREIATMLPRIGAGRTLVVAAHRLGTLVDFDRIYVLEKGRVVESGGHDELLRSGGRYSRFWHAQGGAAPAPEETKGEKNEFQTEAR